MNMYWGFFMSCHICGVDISGLISPLRYSWVKQPVWVTHSTCNLCGGNCIRPSLHCPTNDPFCNQAEIMLLKSGRYCCFHAGLFLGPCCTDIANSNKLLWVMCSGLVMWTSYLLERELRHQQRAKDWMKEKSTTKWNEAASSGRLPAKLLSLLDHTFFI